MNGSGKDQYFNNVKYHGKGFDLFEQKRMDFKELVIPANQLADGRLIPTGRIYLKERDRQD